MNLITQSSSMSFTEKKCESMRDIRGYSTFTKMESVTKGWSGDKKFYIETEDGKRLLLRVTELTAENRSAEISAKQTEYDMMKRLSALGLPISQPVDFGMCDNGSSVYSLLTWCDGEDAETVLPILTETEQYVLGIKAGELLKSLHSIPAPSETEEWGSRFSRKTDLKIEKYRACGIRFPGDDKVIEYIGQNRELLSGRPQCFHHGDYHVGNMVISPDHTLSIIDFNRWDFGDPWEEFNRIVWSATVSPYFATGQIRGYFGGEPPQEFFRLLAFYIASNTLSSIYWAIPFGQGEVDTMMRQSQDVLAWFDSMRNPVPTWYLRDFYIQTIDGISYKLKSPFDLSFIRRYGKVFKVYDDQDSGNLCLGVQSGEDRYFIKFAGAPTARYPGTPQEAIARLKAAIPVYQDLAHPNLVELIQAEEIGGGFAAVFRWTDGECLGRMYPQSRQKFLQIPLSTKLQVFSDILLFHAFIADKGYVAIDFYDGSILYDFTKQKTVICDTDFYARRPYINRVGRLWGSTRFMSPEEFELGAAIDEITNVYLMGATAFALFADYDRTPERWPLSEARYLAAWRAVSNDRAQRQQSIREFMSEWNASAIVR